MFKLINDDCINAMNDLINEGVKVDLVLTDPPYGTTDCKWDSIISFDDMWGCINQLTKPTTPVLLFSQEPFTTNLQYSNLDNFKYCLYWIKNKSSGFLHAKNKPLVNVECISVFSKGDVNHAKITNNRMTYNPQGLKKTNKLIVNTKTYSNEGKSVYDASSFANDHYVQEYTNYPNLTLDFEVVSTNKVHPTQKPVELLEYLIKTYSNKDDLVLDFTMGSGSTGVACLQTNRDFIGIELDETYYNIAKKRCKEYQSKLF